MCSLFCDQQIFHICEAVKELLSLRKSQAHAGGGEDVGFGGGGADDRHSCQFVVDWISGSGIEDMVIEHIVFVETAFINAGGDHGSIPDIYSSHRCPAWSEGLLDANTKRAAVRLCTDGQHVAAQADTGTVNPLGEQVFFHFICNISFGDGTQVYRSSGIFQTDYI